MIDDLMQRENYVLAKKLLDVSHAKQNAIASNLANVETPGYKRIDIATSFDAQLKRAAEANDVQGIRDLQFSTIRDVNSPNQRADGNNVQIDQEMLAMQKNAIQFEFLANYTSSSLSRLKTAISGRI